MVLIGLVLTLNRFRRRPQPPPSGIPASFLVPTCTCSLDGPAGSSGMDCCLRWPGCPRSGDPDLGGVEDAFPVNCAARRGSSRTSSRLPGEVAQGQERGRFWS